MIDASWKLPDWKRYLDRPETTGRLRASPEDFQVWELPLVEPQGVGSHLWLEIRKRNANTQWVAGRLAAVAGVPVRDVGFAGMKDRQAVTTQWFSIGLQEATQADWATWDIPGVDILQAQRHGRKLRRGALRGNRFRIVLRDVHGPLEALERRLGCVAVTGVPNYFGPQRFGRDGANVGRAARWLHSGARIRRNQRGIYLSAARSYLFNLVLSERVRQGTWNHLIDGDLAMLDGSRSTFRCSLPEPELERRCAAFDIHPTGPLPGHNSGRDNSCTSGEAATMEDAALAPHGDLVEALRRAGVDADRRTLRVVPADLAWQLEGSTVTLEFALPPGAYATSVLRELVLIAPDLISEDS